MSSHAPTVSVVIPTNNRRALLARVVAPLLADAGASEIVIVINGADDGSLAMLEEIARDDPRLRPLYVEEAGRERARQVGLDAATGEIVLFMDDDVLAAPGLASGHARVHAQLGDGFVVLGYMPVADPSKRRPGDAYTLLYAAEYEGRCDEYERNPDSILKGLWGGNMSMRRSAAARFGLTGVARHDYHEDRDFGLRCLKAGLHGHFDRSLRAQHLHERSLENFLRDARRQGAERVEIHARHSDVLPSVDEREFARGLPAPVRGFVLACKRPRLAAWSRGLLSSVAMAAGRFRLWWAETAAVKVLRRIEQQRGAGGGS